MCGTAAAEGWPALFCRCPVCLEARKLGGKNVRTRAAYALGDRIRIDMGPDTMAHSIRYNLALENLQHLLVTHSHQDHWLPSELYYRKPGFSLVPEDAVLTVHGNEHVVGSLRERLGDELGRYRLALNPIKLWEWIDLGDGVSAVPIEADHAQQETAVNYVIRANGKTLLQGNDTGWYPEQTWEFLSQLRLDVVLLDCTNGKIDAGRGHMGCSWVVRARDRLAEAGALAENCRFVATHFSHNGGWLHEELEEYFGPHGIEVAYDGMAIEL
ncbi:MAG: MBL fold metallo-hydrolase [Armatimonadota bacterium]